MVKPPLSNNTSSLRLPHNAVVDTSTLELTHKGRFVSFVHSYSALCASLVCLYSINGTVYVIV